MTSKDKSAQGDYNPNNHRRFLHGNLPGGLAPSRVPLSEEKTMQRRLSILALTAAALLCFAALSSRDVFAQQKSRTVLVHDVISVDLSFEKSDPPNALVKAKGMVTTGGYKNPRLEPVIYVTPPADGIHELRFMADTPTGGMVIQVLTPLETPILRIAPIPKWFKGVRVISETNKIEKKGP
jgi:hypothetical protein